MTQAKPKLLARAAAVKAANKGNPALVVATSDDSILKSKSITAALNELEYVACGCKDCGTKVLSSVSTPEPFCVSCGSSNVLASTKRVKAKTELAGSLMAVACPSCRTSNVLQASTMKALKSIHCIQCSTHLKADAVPTTDTNGEPKELRNDGVSHDGMKVTEVAEEDKNFNGKNDKGIEITADAEDDDAMDDLDDMVSAGWPQSTGDTEVAAEADGDKPAMEAPKDEKAEAEEPKEPKEAEEPKEENAEAVHDNMEGIDAALGEDEESETADVEWSDEGDDVAFDSIFDDQTPLNVEDNGDGELELVQDDDSIGDEHRIVVDNDMGIVGGDSDIGDFDMLGLEDPAIVAKAVKAAKQMEIAELTTGEPLWDTVELDDKATACYFVQSGTKLLAMKGHYAVASLTAQRAGDNADIMMTDGFTSAVLHQVASVGMRKALVSAGFAPILTKNVGAATVRASVQAETKKIQAARKEADATTAECFALAAAGLARGMWKGQPNPLKAAFESELNRRGERKPGRLAATLFAKHGIEYTKVLCEVAGRLQAKSKDARKELADTLDMVTDEPMQDTTMYAPDAQDSLNEVISDADEMPMNDYSLEGMDPALEDDFSEDYVDSSNALTARFSRPAARVTSNKQVPSLFRPRNNDNGEAVTAAHKVLSGNMRLSFEDEIDD